MPHLNLDDQNALFYLHHASEGDKPTFVFVNALTGTTDHWEAVVAPALRAQGFGTLSYNFRGQTDSPFASGVELTPDLIVNDLVHVCQTLGPKRPILVGLSIGGLFAAQAIRAGVDAAGLVYLNTIREIGLRIAWVNDGLGLFAAKTGVGVMMDATFPMLVNPDFLESVRPNMLKVEIAPLPPEHGHANLMRNSAQADWAFPWDSLSLPTLNITGLCDRVFLDRDIVEGWLNRLADVERMEWADCGHLVPLERPEKLADALAEFGGRLNA
ncbi:MAG: alpha/beta fold hydrolase [Pseudomonadota bacterium]